MKCSKYVETRQIRSNVHVIVRYAVMPYLVTWYKALKSGVQNMGYDVQAQMCSTRGYRRLRNMGIGSGEYGFEKHDLTQAYGRAWG